MIKNTEEPELDIKPKFNKISYPSSMEQSQVDSLNLLIENKDLKTEDVYLSTKIDGSLCSVIACKKSSIVYNIMKEIIESKEENPYNFISIYR